MIYTREFTDEEMKCMEDSVVDVQQWVDDAINGKIQSCRKKILRKVIETSLDQNLPIPSTSTEILNQVFYHPDYKNRKQIVDQEEAQLLEKIAKIETAMDPASGTPPIGKSS